LTTKKRRELQANNKGQKIQNTVNMVIYGSQLDQSVHCLAAAQWLPHVPTGNIQKIMNSAFKCFVWISEQ
jgi:hypothetical protein